MDIELSKTMFKEAKLKLTGWYLAIIMSITIAFSSTVYFGVVQYTQIALESQMRKIERQMEIYGENFPLPKILEARYDIEALLEFRKNTFVTLLGINLLVLIISAVLGYFLAGKTLDPIEQMIQKQKRFISDAAHEIRTPLTAMKTDLEVTLRDKNLKISDSKAALSNTIEEIDRLHILTTRLLEKSRAQNSEELVDPKIIHADEILNKVVSKFSNLAKEKNQVIKTFIKPSKVKGDPLKIEELFSNILENAIKYNFPQKEIIVRMEIKRGNSVTQIIDHGIGISEQDLPNVFEPFYRTDQSRTNSGKEGYGLGLSISKEIVSSHKGHIHIRSKPSQGTTVTITIPAIQS